MPQTKAVRRVRFTSDYIKTTKGGTRYVRAIDVLRSEGGRKAIGALMENTTDTDAPSTNGASTSNGSTRSANGHAREAESESDEESSAAEVPVARASSASG